MTSAGYVVGIALGCDGIYSPSLLDTIQGQGNHVCVFESFDSYGFISGLLNAKGQVVGI